MAERIRSHRADSVALVRLGALGADGRFCVVLIPGCRYLLKGKPYRREMLFYLTIDSDLAIEPVQTKDLGTMKFNKNGKPIRAT